METKKVLPKLPKSFKTRWIKALRSGKFKQGRFNLMHKKGSENHYCCLGVACVLGGVNPRPGVSYWIGDHMRGKVPNMLIGNSHVPNILSRMNDLSTSSFNEIADYIEANL